MFDQSDCRCHSQGRDLCYCSSLLGANIVCQFVFGCVSVRTLFPFFYFLVVTKRLKFIRTQIHSYVIDTFWCVLASWCCSMAECFAMSDWSRIKLLPCFVISFASNDNIKIGHIQDLIVDLGSDMAPKTSQSKYCPCQKCYFDSTGVSRTQLPVV